MKASDLFVKCLEAEGITHIFGVPGEENADFMLSLEDSSIEFILTRHEQGAAFMAEVYGRLTGNPAGCLGTLGPGATNLLTGVADANMDRAPMLVLTGQGATTRQHKESHQVMNVVEMYKPVTKWAHAIHHQDNIPEVVRKAVRLARSEKPGAVHLELAENLAKLDTTTRPMPVRRFRRPVPDAAVIAEAVELIRKARRPVILAGNGTIRKRASQELRHLCELTNIGVVSTFMAKGAVDCDAPYCLFTIGMQARDYTSCVLEAADLIITVGYDMVEYPPRLWNSEGKARIIHIDFLPAEIDAKYNPESELVGDIATTLSMLREGLEANPSFDYDLALQAQTRKLLLDDFAEHKDDANEGQLRPQKVLWDVRQVMRPGDIVLSDVGAHKMWIARNYHCHEPNACLIPNGFCSMGFALPGAIAANIVHPDRRVLAIAGDGGFMMNVQEMETAARLKSNIVVMVWVDGGYGLISWKQETEFGRHTELSFGNPDWLQLASAFGWTGMVVNSAAELRGKLEQAFNTPGPTLMAVPIDYNENRKLIERLGKLVCPI